MKVLLRQNLRKEKGTASVGRVAQKLLELSVTPMVDEGLAGQMPLQKGMETGPLDILLEQCDMVVSVGGDGTMMHSALLAIGADKPVLGINEGRLGFLTQLEMNELDCLAALPEGKYRVSERILLEAELELEGQRKRIPGLNDVVITRNDAECMVDIVVRQQEAPVARYRADGIIFATPTGSTAYSLSAGGPIISPGISAIVLTAICPHAMSRASLVLPTDRSYVIQEEVIPGASPVGLAVAIDGKRVGTIEAGQTIMVGISEAHAKFVDLGLRDFYSKLNKKLSWGR